VAGQEGLGASTDGDHRVVGDRIEIGADVAGHLGAAVHAADPARGEDGDARRGGKRH